MFVCHFIQQNRVQLTNSNTHTHAHAHAHVLQPSELCLYYVGEPVPEPIWILLKQETVSGSGISWAIHKSADRPRQITTPALNPFLLRNNRVKALKVLWHTVSKQNIAVRNYPHHYRNSKQRWYSHLYQLIKAGTNLVTLKGSKAELNKLAWIHTEMVYPPQDGKPSQYQPHSTLSNFVDATNNVITMPYCQPTNTDNTSGNSLYKTLWIIIKFCLIGRGMEQKSEISKLTQNHKHSLTGQTVCTNHSDTWCEKACYMFTAHTHNTHTHTTVLRLCGNCPGQPGWAGTRRNIHPLHSS